MVRGLRLDRRWVEELGVWPLEEGLLRQCFIISHLHLDEEERRTTAEEDGLMVGDCRAET
jgi:hypothetical protein